MYGVEWLPRRFTTSTASIHGCTMLPCLFLETAISLSCNSHHSLDGSYPSMRVHVHDSSRPHKPGLVTSSQSVLRRAPSKLFCYSMAVVASRCEATRLLDFTICFFRHRYEKPLAPHQHCKRMSLNRQSHVVAQSCSIRVAQCGMVETCCLGQ
jgi:hypothetical protein